MAKLFEFNSVKELEEAVDNKDLYLSVEVYKQIKKAVNNKYKKVTAFSAKVSEHDILDFELNYEQWSIALNTCIDVFSENDMFEECIDIQSIIKQL